MAQKANKKVPTLLGEAQYHGKYVAIDSSRNNEVIASGTDVGKVIEKARAKGFKVPSIVFVPEKDVAYIY